LLAGSAIWKYSSIFLIPVDLYESTVPPKGVSRYSSGPLPESKTAGPALSNFTSSPFFLTSKPAFIILALLAIEPGLKPPE